MLITVQTILDLKPCAAYPAERLAQLIPSTGVLAKDALRIVLALPRADARWVLARLLSVADRVTWAKACAGRAKDYAADADAAAYAAYAAAYAAADAAYANAAADAADAAYAADAADAAYAAAAANAAANAAEHRLACKHALALLGGAK